MRLIELCCRARTGCDRPEAGHFDSSIHRPDQDGPVSDGAGALPGRVEDPDRKGRAERGVGHAKQTPLEGRRSEGLEGAQPYLGGWAGTRIPGIPIPQASGMFAEEQASRFLSRWNRLAPTNARANCIGVFAGEGGRPTVSTPLHGPGRRYGCCGKEHFDHRESISSIRRSSSQLCGRASRCGLCRPC